MSHVVIPLLQKNTNNCPSGSIETYQLQRPEQSNLFHPEMLQEKVYKRINMMIGIAMHSIRMGINNKVNHIFLKRVIIMGLNGQH